MRSAETRSFATGREPGRQAGPKPGAGKRSAEQAGYLVRLWHTYGRSD